MYVVLGSINCMHVRGETSLKNSQIPLNVETSDELAIATLNTNNYIILPFSPISLSPQINTDS